MPRTRLSLYYLVTYLVLTGFGLMLAPSAVLAALGATHQYDDYMPRFAGVLMVALGFLVSQIIRFRLEMLYPMTLAVRVFIWVFVLWLYLRSGDTMFAMVLGVVGLGLLLTGSCWLLERARR